MASPLYPPSRAQSVGEILDLGLRIFGATLLRCLGYSAAAMVVGQLASIYALVRHHGPMDPLLVRDPRWWLLLLVSLVGAIILTSALIVRQYELASGRSLASGGPLAVGVRRAGGMLLMLLVASLAGAACVVPLAVAAGIVAALAYPGASPAVIGAGVMILAIFPASWLLVRWMCAGWVYLLTERGAIDSLRHSWHLTRGSFWRLTTILTVAVVLALVMYLLSFMLTGIATMLVGYRDVAVVTAAGTVVLILLRVIISPFYTALVLAAYGDLTVRREGADLAQRIAAAG